MFSLVFSNCFTPFVWNRVFFPPSRNWKNFLENDEGNNGNFAMESHCNMHRMAFDCQLERNYFQKLIIKNGRSRRHEKLSVDVIREKFSIQWKSHEIYAESVWRPTATGCKECKTLFGTMKIDISHKRSSIESFSARFSEPVRNTSEAYSNSFITQRRLFNASEPSSFL